jgi:hypothetical protein
LPSAVKPGPSKPKELDTFLRPLVEELKQLDRGVEAFDESLHFPRSYPVDIMHCISPNITETLFKLWIRIKLRFEQETLPIYGCHLSKDSVDAISKSLATARRGIYTDQSMRRPLSNRQLLQRLQRFRVGGLTEVLWYFHFRSISRR